MNASPPVAGNHRRRVASVVLGIAVAATLAAVAISGPPAGAESLRYRLEIRDQESTRYTLEVPLVRPGVLTIGAAWDGPRTLSFRVEGPGEPPVKARRAGPSPQTLQVRVTEDDVARGGPWILSIQALPARGAATGKLTVDLPAEVAPDPVGVPDPDLPAGEPEGWTVAREAPDGIASEVAYVFAAVERLRSWVVLRDGGLRRDACGWQTDLLRYLAARRDAVADTGEIIPETTRRYAARLARAVRRIDDLRSSDDPILAGPMPEDESRRRAWTAVRRRRLEPIESELDGLGTALRRGYASELASESWPQRFVGCLTACERHFEQRVRLGEDRASGGELARAQWDGFLAAADALDALAWVHGALPALESGTDETGVRPASE